MVNDVDDDDDDDGGDDAEDYGDGDEDDGIHPKSKIQNLISVDHDVLFQITRS